MQETAMIWHFFADHRFLPSNYLAQWPIYRFRRLSPLSCTSAYFLERPFPWPACRSVSHSPCPNQRATAAAWRHRDVNGPSVANAGRPFASWWRSWTGDTAVLVDSRTAAGPRSARTCPTFGRSGKIGTWRAVGWLTGPNRAEQGFYWWRVLYLTEARFGRPIVGDRGQEQGVSNVRLLELGQARWSFAMACKQNLKTKATYKHTASTTSSTSVTSETTT